MRFTPAEAFSLMDPRLARFDGIKFRPPPHRIEHDVLENALRLFLIRVAELEARTSAALPGWKFKSTAELVWREAEVARANFNDMTVQPMAPGLCFENCYALSQAGFGRYAEGYALMCGAGEPFHHAWLVDSSGRIQDPTWKPMYEDKRVREPFRDWSGNVVYLGFTIEPETHREWTERLLYPNLLSVCDDDIPDVLELGTDAWG